MHMLRRSLYRLCVRGQDHLRYVVRMLESHVAHGLLRLCPDLGVTLFEEGGERFPAPVRHQLPQFLRVGRRGGVERNRFVFVFYASRLRAVEFSHDILALCLIAIDAIFSVPPLSITKNCVQAWPSLRRLGGGRGKRCKMRLVL